MQIGSSLKTSCQKPHSLIRVGISQIARKMLISSSLYSLIFKENTDSDQDKFSQQIFGESSCCYS